MKKVISIVLIMALATCLFACSSYNEQAIKNALVGKWVTVATDGEKVDLGYQFNADGTGCFFMGRIENPYTYVIENEKIILTYDSGKTTTLIYSYSNGTLLLKTDVADRWNLEKQ